MATTTCIKCSGHSFEFSSFPPIGESRKVTILQCATCGTPVGLLDRVSGLQMEALQDQIMSIDDRLTRIAKALTE
jgi:hypothetical protein